MPGTPTASIVIPTRARPDYLDVTLASILPQASGNDAEVLVVADAGDGASVAIARGHGARVIALAAAGANAKRNAGVAAARAGLLVFVDDDVHAPPGWLDSVLSGARAANDRDVFGGPIRARLEGGGPRACGREQPPITALELGAEDRDVPFVWSANMAIRARALRQVGGFDETIFVRGDEEEWLRRYRHHGGQIRYLASAGLDHRRSAPDSTVRALARAAYGHGRAARRYDIRRRTAPAIWSELRTLAGCAWHTARRRCALGIVMGAHAAGRVREALADERS
jgi:GT2 family glycosyltransferase